MLKFLPIRPIEPQPIGTSRSTREKLMKERQIGEPLISRERLSKINRVWVDEPQFRQSIFVETDQHVCRMQIGMFDPRAMHPGEQFAERHRQSLPQFALP